MQDLTVEWNPLKMHAGNTVPMNFFFQGRRGGGGDLYALQLINPVILRGPLFSY